MVASHMEANAALYRGFVCQPVATNSKYNADTEPPTDEDEYINSNPDVLPSKYSIICHDVITTIAYVIA